MRFTKRWIPLLLVMALVPQFLIPNSNAQVEIPVPCAEERDPVDKANCLAWYVDAFEEDTTDVIPTVDVEDALVGIIIPPNASCGVGGSAPELYMTNFIRGTGSYTCDEAQDTISVMVQFQIFQHHQWNSWGPAEQAPPRVGTNYNEWEIIFGCRPGTNKRYRLIVVGTASPDGADDGLLWGGRIACPMGVQ